jgi:putative ABC transport system permease protein
MGSVLKDLRLALRQCRRQPGFAAAVVSTLALAIGANTGVFLVVDAVLLRALPFAASERLVYLTSVRSDSAAAPFSLPEFMDYREQARGVAIAAFANWSASIPGEGFTERFQGSRMSANAFEVLGVSPAAGRLLRASDDEADAPRVAVLSHRLWQRRFGGAADVVGRSLRINGEPFEVVGVLPPHFPLPLRDIDVVAPLVPDRDPNRHVRNSVNFLRFIGRLQPGVTPEQARQELSSICATLRAQFPAEYARKQAVGVEGLREVLIGDYRPAMMLLLASVAAVLSVALANLLSFVLVRANERRSETSIRIALGASRGRLMRQFTVETLLLALAGGGLGCALAIWGARVAVAWAPAIPRLTEIAFDGRALLFAAGLTLAAALLLGLAPVGGVLRARARDALRLGSRGAVSDRWNDRLRRALVLGEISAAVVLVLATALLVQSLVRLQQVRLGFRPDAVFQARVSLPPTYRSPADLARFSEELGGRLGMLPGVRDVGLISVAPMSGLLAAVPFTVADQGSGIERDSPSANIRAITPGYLAAAGTRLLGGRALSERDGPDAPPVALVSAALAERFLDGEALGRRLLIDDNNVGPRPVEIVGVVEDVRQEALDGPATLDVYIPLRQIHADGVIFVRNNHFWMIRADAAPATLRVPFLAALRQVDRDAAIASTGTMGQYLEEWLAPRRFSLALFVAFSLAAVLLAVNGLYGLVAYTVSKRRPEIGLRMAIGATARDVQRLILRQVTRLALGGAAVGLAVAVAGRPLVSRLVADVALEPGVVVATIGLLVAVVILAGWLPARRAARIAPTAALRGE